MQHLKRRLKRPKEDEQILNTSPRHNTKRRPRKEDKRNKNWIVSWFTEPVRCGPDRLCREPCKHALNQLMDQTGPVCTEQRSNNWKLLLSNDSKHRTIYSAGRVQRPADVEYGPNGPVCTEPVWCTHRQKVCICTPTTIIECGPIYSLLADHM
jgi:hypothetical protein